VERDGAETGALESAARKLALTILFADVRTSNDIEGAFATMTRSRAGVQHRLPGIHLIREYAEAGLLQTYSGAGTSCFPKMATLGFLKPFPWGQSYKAGGCLWAPSGESRSSGCPSDGRRHFR
jgi:hypothetical protein